MVKMNHTFICTSGGQRLYIQQDLTNSKNHKINKNKREKVIKRKRNSLIQGQTYITVNEKHRFQEQLKGIQTDKGIGGQTTEANKTKK